MDPTTFIRSGREQMDSGSSFGVGRAVGVCDCSGCVEIFAGRGEARQDARRSRKAVDAESGDSKPREALEGVPLRAPIRSPCLA